MLILGRDAFVARAIGTNNFGGITYWTTAKYMAGLLAPGSLGYERFLLQFSFYWFANFLYLMVSVNHGKHAHSAEMWILIV